ncbi:MAG TPA: YMGG-like glycine zipper-containing protein [Gammaproteobacteria bacterium]|nr:YMGG-like glycine zipper-containing protein [Gammaproteobacteria bacterium]
MQMILKTGLLAAAALTLGGCATLPTGPTVMVLPGQGKSFEQFRQDNMICRQYAYDEIGGKTAQQTANESTLKSAGVGALLGGALGAAAGNGRGAGIGAASGALMGTAIGSSNGYGDAYGVQQRYNYAYEQCMYAKGNRIPVAGGRNGYSGHHNRYPPPPPPSGSGQGQPYPPPPPPGSPPPSDDGASG